MMFLLQLSPLQGFTQEERWLQVDITGGFSKQDVVEVGDSLDLQNKINAAYQGLNELGYLDPRPIEQDIGQDTIKVTIHTGEKFEWIALHVGNVDPQLGIKAGVDLKAFERKPFNYLEVSKVFEKFLLMSENNGFPFASIRLDSITREDSRISASLNFSPGPYITFDTLKVTGDSKTKAVYLSNLLQVKPGKAFSQKRITQGIRQIKNLSYLRWAGEPELSFQNQEATLYLPISDRKINTIDGIIGFLPNEIEQNKLLVTGQFELALFNVAGKGREYQIRWQRLSQFSQNLKISAVEPLILGSELDLKASFYLLKEDTTFLNRNLRIDFGYRPHTDGYLSFFFKRQAGDLLATSGFQQSTRLPEFVDFRFNNYGMQYELFKLDELFLPRRGRYGKIEFGVGNKNILTNTGLPEALYTDVDMKSIQYYIQGSFQQHLYFTPSWGAYMNLSAGMMDNKNLFGNDLYRLGGLRSIRGFNENFFFATNYVYFNFEPRFYFDTYSYFLIFADLARLENSVQGFTTDFPVSTGMGFSLETGSGIFNFVYALGKSNAQVFALNLSKIHFGYTGRF
jgi:outer membrane protein assembly factor BamA